MMPPRLSPAAGLLLLQQALLLLLLPQYARCQDTAALVIGGHYDGASGGSSSNVVETELFGCKTAGGAPALSVQVADYPVEVWLPAGILMEEENGREVLVCGGYAREGSGGFQITDKCWRYNPADDSWTADTTLVQPRWGHTFEYVPDANNGSPNAPEVPVVFGTLMECDEYDPDAGTFADYRNDLPEEDWFYSQCMVNVDGILYHWNHDDMDSIDLKNWEHTVIGQLPEAMLRPGRCAPVEIDGFNGILTRTGYWLNVTGDMGWVLRAHAPAHPLAASVNAMYSFQGLPTLFGNPECNEEIECPRTEVLQYDPIEDAWLHLGSLLFDRELHEVVEVPISYCDHFDLEAAPTEQPPTTTTTTTTNSTEAPGGGGGDGDGAASVAASAAAIAASLVVAALHLR